MSKPAGPVKVRYVGPIGPMEPPPGATDIPSTAEGEHGGRIPVVCHGDVVTVPAEVAGRPPCWRPLAEGETRHPDREHRDRDGRAEVRELGNGLLAQVGNWELVAAERQTDKPTGAGAPGRGDR